MNICLYIYKWSFNFFELIYCWITEKTPGCFQFFCSNCEGKQHASRYRFSPWAQVFGLLAALLTLLFWRSKAEVFVDRACIHQGYLENKKLERGIFLGWAVHAKARGFNGKGSWKFTPHAVSQTSNEVTHWRLTRSKACTICLLGLCQACFKQAKKHDFP